MRLVSAQVDWKKWGPYLSERQWGTVREDYSENGDAWDYFTHDQARSRAYRWGEDGLAGISDDKQLLCFALALWNGNDPILKERLFGLTNSEGNHGEDVKEYYFYLDSTPTHSYMKYLYKYPQAAFPYEDLVETNRRRGRERNSSTSCWTPVSSTTIGTSTSSSSMPRKPRRHPHPDHASTIAVLMRPELHVLPTLWFRNAWSLVANRAAQSRCSGRSTRWQARCAAAAANPELGEFVLLHCDGDVPLLFTENETNNAATVRGAERHPYVKDGINDCVVHGEQER